MIDVAEYQIECGARVVEVVEVRIERAWGVERWGVGVGIGGKLLDYFEYARQRAEVTAVYHPIAPSALLCRPTPQHILDVIMARLREASQVRHENELSLA